jgi:hypothetical protein
MTQVSTTNLNPISGCERCTGFGYFWEYNTPSLEKYVCDCEKYLLVKAYQSAYFFRDPCDNCDNQHPLWHHATVDGRNLCHFCYRIERPKTQRNAGDDGKNSNYFSSIKTIISRNEVREGVETNGIDAWRCPNCGLWRESDGDCICSIAGIVWSRMYYVKPPNPFYDKNHREW